MLANDDKFSSEISDWLYTSFEDIRDYKSGVSNNKKGKVLEEFFIKILKHIFAYDNSYVVKAQYPLLTKEGLSIKSDICILKSENPIWYVESKDYADIDMYKRYVIDAILLRSNYPDMKYLILSMQSASNDTSKDIILKELNLNDIAYHLDILNIKRNSYNQLYVLSMNKHSIRERVCHSIEALKQMLL